MEGQILVIPKRIRAVIFDLDDTLVESSVDFAKFKRLVIDRIGSFGDDKSLYSPNETIVKIVARYELRMREEGLKEEIIKSRLSELDKIMDEVELERVSETVAIVGSVELLSYLRSRGILVGILTRGCHEYTLTALSLTGMSGLVDEIECRNSKTKAKPDPESYLKLAANLGVSKDETIFIGDHPIDAQCAANAGVAFIGVGTGDVAEEVLMKAGSVAYFPDVRHLLGWFHKRLDG